MTGIQTDIKEIMESVPEVNWRSQHRIIRRANNRLLYDLFPDRSRGYIRSIKSRVLKNWEIIDAQELRSAS